MSDRDEYARVRDELIEGDPIAVVDELLELRRQVAGFDYEYAVQWKEISTGELDSEDRLYWVTKEEAEEILDRYNEQVNALELQRGGKITFTGELVKRRRPGKPGKVEKV